MRGWLWLLVVLALGGLFWWGMQRNPEELPSVLAKERRPAPDFTLPAATRDGLRPKPITLSGLRGQTVVLAFFPKARTGG